MADATPRKNPYGAFNFILEDGDQTRVSKTIAQFMECTGLDMENTPIEYREGTDQMSGLQSGQGSGAFVRKLAGMERYPNVTLRRGIAGDATLWAWRKNVRDADSFNPTVADHGTPVGTGGSPMASIVITLLSEKQGRVMSWTLKNPWICKLSGPSLNAKGNELAIESCEIACDRIEITFPTVNKVAGG